MPGDQFGLSQTSREVSRFQARNLTCLFYHFVENTPEFLKSRGRNYDVVTHAANILGDA
jgi:hypothetical protein